MKKITVIGGGTGTATVLSALSKDNKFDLTAIVSVSDSGGSTGRLRDEFGFIPVGDIRQCLSALATGKNSERVKEMLLYRFDKGDGLKGHNLGNLILTALTDLYQTPGKAIEVASKILRINGRVYPISEQANDLVITYEDGTKVIGEDYLNFKENSGKKITQIDLQHRSEIYRKAKMAIMNAEVIIMGPGDLYASLLPHTRVSGFKEALLNCSGKFVYIANLMTCLQQTHQMTAKEHLGEIIKYCQRQPDYIVLNQEKITNQQVIANYQAEGYEPLIDDLQDLPGPIKIIRENLVSPVVVKKEKGDNLPRNFLRHHSENLKKVIRKISEEN